MKNILLCILVIGFFQVSCSKEEKYLDVSNTDINLDAAGTAQKIKVQTSASIWQIAGETGWVSIDRDSCFLVISSTSNPTRTQRSAKIVIVADGLFERILVNQPGSIRAVGEPYPNAENPIGIIYKLTHGGEHGKVISLDQVSHVWGPTSDVNISVARSLDNGKSNTRAMINTYRERSDFNSTYPAFAWIYNEKNGGDINGEWYIPSFYELNEMHHLLTGNAYSIPTTDPPNSTPGITYNIQARDEFNFIMKEYGGVPMNYERMQYWSSTEYDITRSRVILFGDQSTATSYGAKTLVCGVRAIYEF